MVAHNTKTNGFGLKALYQKEDAWAVWIGLIIVASISLIWLFGGDAQNFVLVFSAYDSFSETPALVWAQLPRILIFFAVLTTVFCIAVESMGHDTREFLKGFLLLFIIAVIVEVLGSWNVARAFNLETPVIALILGMIIGNFVRIPHWFDSAMRTEFYVKTGIVIMGATLPFSFIINAGPVAFGQAACISIITFLVVYSFGAYIFRLNKPFAATLAAGSSICGVSASIAIGSSVNAKKSHVSISITLVVIWATIMMFLLPIVCRTLGVEGAVAGAWIGSSEYADAAGVAAAARFGDEALATFTITKVLGRDLFVGVWSLVMALVSVMVWERKSNPRNSENGSVGGGQKPSVSILWERFPKFVLGFLVTSAIVSMVALYFGTSSTGAIMQNVVVPLRSLRDWAFVLCFLCIGMTTRIRDLATMSWKPMAAFSIGVLINFALGWFFSTVVFGSYWASL